MTRKCVLCKETNYKNSYSFFSAPKDTETREKWQEAIGIDNYIVNDETFVCSRHFTPGDIITHWVSGIPPHVVTIKYKKCRLRPGAVPSNTYRNLNIMHNAGDDDDEFDEFEKNRQWGNDKKLFKSRDNRKEVFLIPRTDNIITYTNIDMHSDVINTNDSDNVELEEYITETLATESPEEEEQDDDDDDDDGINQEQSLIDNHEHHQSLEILQSDVEMDENTVYLKESDDPSIIYVEDINLSNECEDETNLMQFVTIKEVDVFPSTKLHLSNEKEERDGDNDSGSNQDVDSSEMWSSMEKRSDQCSDEKLKETCDDEDMPIESLDPPDENEDSMLFEDFLEAYTDVKLPSGWSSMVISGGKATTVIYACMNVSQNDIPYMQKQVYLKNDMILHCSATGTIIDPKLHSLLREGRQLRVNTLADVEEFIDEFHQRVICDGTLEKLDPTEIDTSLAYRHDVKWRHVDCPIIINNGTPRCSKCSLLSVQMTRRKVKKSISESAELLRKDRTINFLQKLLAKMTKKNRKSELMKESSKSISSIVSSLDVPKIQQLMIQECLKSAVLPNSDEVVTEFTETWLFLSLLIYIESPRMYRFLLLNKYMHLPGIKVMRRYLHQIKTDDQFYKLFQRTVEPFQHSENRNTDEIPPT